MTKDFKNLLKLEEDNLVRVELHKAYDGNGFFVFIISYEDLDSWITLNFTNKMELCYKGEQTSLDGTPVNSGAVYRQGGKRNLIYERGTDWYKDVQSTVDYIDKMANGSPNKDNGNCK